MSDQIFLQVGFELGTLVKSSSTASSCLSIATAAGAVMSEFLLETIPEVSRVSNLEAMGHCFQVDAFCPLDSLEVYLQ